MEEEAILNPVPLEPRRSSQHVDGGGASLEPRLVLTQQPTPKPSSSEGPSWSPTREKEGEEER